MASKQVEGEMFLSICKIVLCPAEILAHQIQFSFDVAFNVMKGSRRQNVAVYITRLPLLKERLKNLFETSLRSVQRASLARFREHLILNLPLYK